tara:strand:- start:1340 stop:1498 length:159 start_codon:yes stop_codon:yes gene_type:complete
MIANCLNTSAFFQMLADASSWKSLEKWNSHSRDIKTNIFSLCMVISVFPSVL